MLFLFVCLCGGFLSDVDVSVVPPACFSFEVLIVFSYLNIGWHKNNENNLEVLFEELSKTK